MSVAPDSLNKRSTLYRVHLSRSAEFAEIAHAACAMTSGASVADETARARSLAICDASPLPRGGFKGPKAIAWARDHGVEVSDENNMTVVQPCGARAARLADTEVLLLSDLEAKSGLIARVHGEWSPDPDPGGYPVPRDGTNCWFMVSGEHAPAMFAKVCGIDLRGHKFPDGSVAQTSLARLNSIIIRGDVGEVTAFHVLTDSASAGYMWMCLNDAMDEFSGVPVGLGAMRTLAGGGP